MRATRHQIEDTQDSRFARLRDAVRSTGVAASGEQLPMSTDYIDERQGDVVTSKRPAISDRVESIRGSATGYNGSEWRPSMSGELTAYPPAVRALPCQNCRKRHQTFALVEFWTYATDDDALESSPRKVYDRVALAICDIRKV